MADGMFGNMFDVRRQQRQNLEESAMDFARLPRGRGQVAAATMAGGLGGRAITGALGMQTPEEMKATKVQSIFEKYRFSDKNDPSTYLQIANELMPVDPDSADQAMEIYKALQPKAATLKAQRETEEQDNTIKYLEGQYGVKLSDQQKSYLKARAKKNVTVTEGGVMVDTLPLLFEQLINQEKTTDTTADKTTDLGVSFTKLADYKATKEDNKMVGKLSKELQPIIDIETKLKDMYDLLKPYTDESGKNLVKDVPGIGATGWLQTPFSDTAAKINTQWNAFIGQVRNELFGSVLTTGETKMFESMLKPNSMIPLSDQDMINFVNRLRNTVEAKRRNIEAVATDEQLELYRQREARSKGLLPKIVSGVEKARNAGANDAQIKEYIIKNFNLTSEEADKYLGAK